MPNVTRPKNPIVLSYLALRKAVGVVALGLPFALSIPWWFARDHSIVSSISGYYYTGMRDLFVGSLCAISMFMLCCRGYDKRDEIAGAFSALCALGVAFFPTEPPSDVTAHQHQIAVAHYAFAALLFSTLAYFCLFLFRLSSATTPTRKKQQRNYIYTGCGIVILVSMLILAVLKIFRLTITVGSLPPVFCFESTALLAFGVAWLTKGESFLKDEQRLPSRTTEEEAEPSPVA